ncbi:MAG: C40 family peptidase, partial [Thermoanaerobaculia bacterium]
MLLWFPAVEHPVLARAVGSLGTPYRFGGTTEKGFDCAGFVRYAYAPLGVDLPRTSASQYLVGEPVEREELQ